MLSDFVQPPHRFGFQARLGRIIGWKYNFDFHFDGKLPALDPPLSFFASFTHGSFPK